MCEMCGVSGMCALCVGRYVPVRNQLVYNYRTCERLAAATIPTMCKHCGDRMCRSVAIPGSRGSDLVPSLNLPPTSRGRHDQLLDVEIRLLDDRQVNAERRRRSDSPNHRSSIEG